MATLFSKLGRMWRHRWIDEAAVRRVPSEYRTRNYVVNDYRAYRLQPPPRGYQWMGVGGDFVLAA
ncbi:RcnB family protein, partial [Variovorax paradoxus]|uniref:RcnB family protein n=1 Tax=Variovorax paradoxus TaxID=34073 RepID=UPI0038D1C6CF